MAITHYDYKKNDVYTTDDKGTVTGYYSPSVAKLKEILINKGYFKESEIKTTFPFAGTNINEWINITTNGINLCAVELVMANSGNNILPRFYYPAYSNANKYTAGGSASNPSWGSNGNSIYRITDCKNGIAVFFHGVYSSDTPVSCGYGLFFTKTVKGDIAIIYVDRFPYNTKNKNNINVYCATTGSVEGTGGSKLNPSFTASSEMRSDKITSLSPLVVAQAADYCPNLFCMPVTQYFGTQGVIRIDNCNYITNGILALKDE